MFFIGIQVDKALAQVGVINVSPYLLFVLLDIASISLLLISWNHKNYLRLCTYAVSIC